MINQLYVMGSSIRKVNIEGRVVVLLDSISGFKPIKIDLDNIRSLDKDRLEKYEEMIDELQKLKTEKDIALDIKRDFQKSGWRLVKS